MRSSDKKTQYLTDVEKEELFRQIDQDTSSHHLRNKALFLLAKYCALRVSEVGLIKLCDYDPRNHLLHCERLKNGNNNTLKIVDPSVYQTVDLYYSKWLHDSSASNALFISQLGRPISRKTLDRLMKHYCSNTSIPTNKWHFHVLRHTRAMELVEYPNVDVRDVQWWLGHKEIQNTMIYLEYSASCMAVLFDNIKTLEGGKSYESY